MAFYQYLLYYKHVELPLYWGDVKLNVETVGSDFPTCSLTSVTFFSESHYKEKLQRRCCKDGLRDIKMPYSCTRRSLYITEGPECILAFRYCCATYRDQVFNTEIPTTPPPMTTAPPTTTLPPKPILPVRGVKLHSSRRVALRTHMFGTYSTSTF